MSLTDYSYAQLSLPLDGVLWRYQAKPTPRRSHPGARHPQNPLHRTWPDFVADMGRLEAMARREQLRLTKTSVAQFGPDCPTTITRTMKRYGLRPSDWPPSRWASTP